MSYKIKFQLADPDASVEISAGHLEAAKHLYEALKQYAEFKGLPLPKVTSTEEREIKL